MKKYENFLSAFHNLKDVYDYEEPYGNVELTGLVGMYGVCFELSWKVMKEILEKSGFEEGKTGSPRQIMKTAYQADLIQDEDLWLAALVSRNNVSHSYNKDIALDIIRDTKEKYYEMFRKLVEQIETNWIDVLENNGV